MTNVLDSGLTEIPTPRRKRITRWHKVKRWFRNHRALSIIFAVVGVLLLIVLLWLLWLMSKLGDIQRFPLDLDDRPPSLAGTTILLAGIDDPERREDLFDMLESGEWEQGEFRSDAIMLLHINTDFRSAQLISIPRDSYVNVEGYGKTKINASFSYGGPSLLTKAVEDLTKVRVDHVMVIDFTHFADLADTLGGVKVNIPTGGTDPTGFTWEPGPVTLRGESAVYYVRARYNLPRGDFDRVQRQQNFLRAVLNQVRSRRILANPFKISELVTELSDLVAVDESFTPGKMRSLAISSRNLRPAVIRFATVPYTGTPTIDGASVVTLDIRATREMMGAMARDQFEVWLANAGDGVDQLPDAAQVD
ncbi:LCP family protein [Nocardioides sp. SYSU D00038]|uniref:LCP family protein n=1 Tax=Nocardioides sp. SYSU D00038 TaxID=2812554 RepID=UPI001966DCA8|nr:LCP family protein [Nocardioides sp. SYSU D00038]